ncbi:MAG: ABC1 kinase family protein [Actinomycetales bacterium]
MNEVPRKSLSRTAKLAALPVSYAGRTALGLGKRLSGQPGEMVSAQLQAATAEQVFKVLGELKGGAMKFGQALSIFEAAFPEEVMGPYRATLTKLQDSAPALPAQTVHSVLAAQLGSTWRNRFESFDDTPAAAASIGQVHRAVWKDGTPVAVKVQYPGAGEALLSDLTQISRAARMGTSWMRGLEIGPILTELKERMVEELDYTAEAEAQERFRTGLAPIEEFAIPAVLAVTEQVLVSEWIDGRALSAVIADGTRAERDLAALRYLELLFLGPSEVGLLHADPHPGNFRLLADGRFGVLDFGAVKHLPDGMPPAIGRLLTVALRGDADAVADGLREEGFVRTRIDSRALLRYLDPFLEPARHEVFTFSRSWLQRLMGKINDPRRPEWTTAMKLNLPPEYLLIHRVWLGGIGVLCQLDGRVAVLDVLEDHLPGFQRPGR